MKVLILILLLLFLFFTNCNSILQIRGNSNQMKKVGICYHQLSFSQSFQNLLILYIFLNSYNLHSKKKFDFKVGQLDKKLFTSAFYVWPVVAILFRDIMDNQQIYNINRKYLEIIGLIFSGVTAAICNGLVMRYSEKLLVFFTSFSIFFTALIPFIFFINSFIFDLFIYESLRMAIWMGFTYVFLK